MRDAVVMLFLLGPHTVRHAQFQSLVNLAAVDDALGVHL